MTNKIKSSVLGFLIGLAVIIPGFSGAQLSIMFKLYDKLMAALSNLFNKKSILFLLPIVLFAIVGFILGLFSIQKLLEISMFCVVLFFAGMMLGGIKTITKEIKGEKISVKRIVLLVVGLLIPISISILACNVSYGDTNILVSTPWYFYIFAIVIGFLIAMTQLIPGLSATSLLMSLGLYDAFIKSVSLTFWKENPHVLLVYLMIVLGGILGIVFISKAVNNLLKNHKGSFYFLVTGLCISSLIAMFYNPEILPFYQNFTSANMTELIIGIVLFVIGTVFVYFVTSYADKKELQNQEITNK